MDFIIKIAIKNKDQEYLYLVMVRNIKVNGKIIK